ncbi:MAG: nucleotidyltransferase family protein [Bacillota bacterium]|nr:nucleotidyltransferase family protein [Bacillota bacterium]
MTQSSTPAWQKSLVSPSLTLHGAIRCLEESALQIVIAVSEEGLLLGTVTDGDIRRGLLRGLDLSSSIASILNTEPLVVPPELSVETALQLMRANKVHQLPVVDQARRVVGLHVWSALTMPTDRPNLVLIMAGGEGMRLRPYTEQCPKPLLPVQGKPMMERIIERARNEGFYRFAIAVHYLGHMIEEYFGDGSHWAVEIQYLREDTPLGTAGAIALLDCEEEKSLIVTNGDVLTDIRFGELLDYHLRNSAAATMAVRLHEWQHPFGVVHTQGINITGFEEKPIARSHINAGIYAFGPQVRAAVAPGERCDIPEVFSRLRAMGLPTIVYPMHEPWLDVGGESDLDRANGRVPR